MKPLLIVFFMVLTFGSSVFANDIDTALVQDGKRALESGRYEEAINCLGKILAKSGDVSYDSKVLALHLASQAYGMMAQFKDPAYGKTIENNLLRAIDLDPEWGYPKKLLEQFRRSKNS